MGHKSSTFSTFALKKRIQTSEQIRDIYFRVRDNLPQWLDNNKITYNHVIFFIWCHNYQDVFLLIIDDLLQSNPTHISIMREFTSGKSPKKIAKKYNLTGQQLGLIKKYLLLKVLNTLKVIKKFTDENMYDINDDIKINPEIKSLNLPPRTYNTLIRNKLYTIAELKTLTYKQLINIRGFGEVSITQIERALGIQYERPSV